MTADEISGGGGPRLSAPARGAGSTAWLLVLLVVVLDAGLTLPLLFRWPADGDTIRYSLALWRWVQGRIPLESAFNAEMSPLYYLLARMQAELLGTGLEALPVLLGWASWISGLVAAALFFAWMRRWFGSTGALAAVLLFMLSPSFWSLHLYGNTNITGFALALAGIAALPGSDRSDPDPGWGHWVRLLLAGLFWGAALSVRADVLLIGPAIAGWILWGRGAPRGRGVVVAGVLALGLWLFLRVAVLGTSTADGTIGRHLRSNLDLQSVGWVRVNLASLLSAGPPLVVVGSIAAFVGLRGPDAARTRWSVLLWMLPAVPFLFFARVHLVRILLPVLPAAVIPLALWTGRGGRGRLAAVLALAIAAQLVMVPVPDLLHQLGFRRLDTARTTQAVFWGNMFRDHQRIAMQAKDTWEDARSLALDETSSGHPPVVVVGEDTIFYELAFSATHPEATPEVLASAYLLRLQVLRSVEGVPRVYLLDRFRAGEPRELLRDLGVSEDVRIHRTLLDRRVWGEVR